MKKIVIIILIICGLTTVGRSENYVLDLETSISIAKMKSLDMLSLKEDLKISEYTLKSVLSGVKTHIDMDLTLPEYTETINQFQDTMGISYYSVKQGEFSGYLTINQPLLTDGYIYLKSGVYDIDDYNDKERWMQTSTVLGISQPIDAFYGFNNIKSEIKEANLDYEQTQKELKRDELNLVYNVSAAFYELLYNQQSEEIAKMNLERQQEAYDIAKNKYEAGLIREVDALQMEVDLADAQNDYDLAIVDVEESQNEFKELIGIELSDSVKVSNEMEYDPVYVDVDKAVKLALENRLEIREQEIQIELNKLSIKEQKAEGMINGDLTAYIQKKGVASVSTKNSIGDAFNGSYDDYQDRPVNFGIGFSVNIPILDWGENKSLVRAAEARLQQNVYEKEAIKRSIETEVRSLVADLNSSLKRLKLLEKNVAIAEKSFAITRSRFSDGDIDSQDLALERERLNNAYTSHLSAYINYELNLANLMRKTFYDFEKDCAVK
jgi:outer membrane protein TolC